MTVRSLLFILGWLLCLPVMASAYDLLVVQSRPSAFYDDVLRSLHSVRTFSERRIILSEYQEVDLRRMVKEEHPLVVVALGDSALAEARKINQVPVLSLLALSYRPAASEYRYVRSIDTRLGPGRYLALCAALKAKRVGVLYNPAKSGTYLKRAKRAAARYGIDLVEVQVSSSKEVVSAIGTLSGKIDALWMIPDTTAVTQPVLEAYFLFALEQRIPLVSFSVAHLAQGAAAVIELDRAELGRQAGEAVITLLNEGLRGDSGQLIPRRGVLHVNQNVLKSLGITLPSLSFSTLGEGD